MYEILVIEDEPAIVESLVFSLKRDGLSARGVHCLAAAREILQSAKTQASPAVDLIILDLMLPDGSGFELLELLRRDEAPPSVIVLSSRDSEADRVRALEGGADDYVTKPFSPREVVARVHAVLRRGARVRVGANLQPSVHLDRRSRRVHVGAQVVELTKVEFDLLALLDSEIAKAFPRAEIIDAVWGDGFALSDRTIDSHIKSLRKKLTEAGGQPEWIETVRGIGYRLSDCARPDPS